MKNESFRRNPRKVPNKDQDIKTGSDTGALGEISSQLDEIQSAAEIGNETLENKNNSIINSLDSINKNTGNSSAANELNLDNTSTISSIASQINNKLDNLTSMLSDKIISAGDNNSVGYIDSLSVISESVPKIEKSNDEIEKSIKGLMLPQPKDPTNDILSDNKEEDKNLPVLKKSKDRDEDTDNKEKTKDDKNSNKLDALIDAVKGGFKTSIGFSDKIASSLFKYTVTALLEAAKTAALILSIIVALDVIRIHFNYWSKLLETNLSEFNDKAGEWGPLLQSIINSVDDVRNMWEKGDFAGLTIAIIKGIAGIIKDLGELIILGLSKAVASMFRAMGADERADNLEGDSLESFQYRTNAKLSDSDQQKLAEYQLRKHKNGDDKDDPIFAGLSPEAIKTINSLRGKSGDSKKTYLDGLDEPDQINVLKAGNEMNAEIERFDDYLSKSDPESNGAKSNLSRTRKVIQDHMSNPVIAKSPELKSMLEQKLNDIDKKYDKFKASVPGVKPEPISESQDIKTVNNIDKSQLVKTNDSKPNQSTTVNQVNQVSNTNKTMYNIPPQTSSVSPGMSGQSMKIN